MGRGNACVHGEHEGLFYVDWDNFSKEHEDEDGEIVIDYDLQRSEWEDSLWQFKKDIQRKFKKFKECDKWISRYERAVLENKLFYIVVEDNEWSMAVKLIQKEQEYYQDGNFKNLQAKLCKIYLDGIRDCLFNQFDELGVYDGVWTSGRIRKGEVNNE